MNEEIELTEELEAQQQAEQEAEAARVAAEAEEANPLPTYITAEQLEANNARLIEQMRTIVQPAQQTQQVQQPVQDTRSPYQIAKAEAETSGQEYNQDWITQRAIEIQSQRQEQTFNDRLTQVVQQLGGMIAPIATNHAITTMAGGDAALAAEIQGTLSSMGVGPEALQNEHVKALILDASRARLSDKATVRKPMPGAAPVNSSVTNTVTGVRAKLTTQQREALKGFEAAFGKYDDQAIAEEFGIN